MAIHYETEFERAEFERVRQEAIRQFEVLLTDGKSVRVFAHSHDAGASVAGHLSFIIVDPNGRCIIDRVFSVHVWQELKEIQIDPKCLADADERLSQVLLDTIEGEGNNDVDAVKNNNPKQRRKASLQRMIVRKDVH